MMKPATDLIREARFFAVGSCRGPERLARCGGSWRPMRFPSLAVMLRHETRGTILFDTGYAPKYFEVLQRWPYRLLTPLLDARLTENESLSTQMCIQCKIMPTDVSSVIISHFHLDHIAGLKDFSAAELICEREALDSIRALKGGWRSLKRVFHPDLLPTDFAARIRTLNDADSNPAHGFANTWDIFGDGSLHAVSLPGHAAGQIGLRFGCGDEQFFLVADACWHEASLREEGGMHPLAELLAWHHPMSGRHTLAALRAFSRAHPRVQLVPSHCPQSVARLVQRRSFNDDENRA